MRKIVIHFVLLGFLIFLPEKLFSDFGGTEGMQPGDAELTSGQNRSDHFQSDERSAAEVSKRLVTIEKLSGEVSGISSKHIAVVYDRKGTSEFEMHLPFDEKVAVYRYRNMSDITLGDTVELQYEKVVESPGEPGERATMTVKSVSLLKRHLEDNVLVSEER